MDNLLTALIIMYLAIAAFGYLLDYLNMRHLERNALKIPPEFEGAVDADFLARARDYTVENTRSNAVVSVFNNVIVVCFLVFGLGPYDSWISSLGLPFITSGIFFFLVLSLLETALSAPWGLYRTFRIEKKYGFNTTTMGLWAGDLLKSIVLSFVIGATLIAAGLWIVEASPSFWWLWVWLFFLAFTVFIMYVSPYVIEPLFNRFEEVRDAGLEEGIRSIMRKAGITVGRILKIDASKRTRHTNAYFTGIGRVKRIVLYDTLMEKLDRDELLTVLAHETGHWKKKHLLKTLAGMEAITLAALYISFRLLSEGFPGELFNMPGASFYASVLILVFIGSIAGFPLGPLSNYISRKHEREADEYAVRLSGNPEAMASSLVKLSRDNLSNLHPHPLYAAFHYSHPPMIERVREIKNMPR